MRVNLAPALRAAQFLDRARHGLRRTTDGELPFPEPETGERAGQKAQDAPGSRRRPARVRGASRVAVTSYLC